MLTGLHPNPERAPRGLAGNVLSRFVAPRSLLSKKKRSQVRMPAGLHWYFRFDPENPALSGMSCHRLSHRALTPNPL